LVAFNLELHRFSFLRVELPVEGYREAAGLRGLDSRPRALRTELLLVFALLIERYVIVIGAVDTGEK
jgi:hypothetical protein